MLALLPHLIPLMASSLLLHTFEIQSLWDGAILDLNIYNPELDHFKLTRSEAQIDFSKYTYLKIEEKIVPGLLSVRYENPTGELYIPQRITLKTNPKWRDLISHALNRNLEQTSNLPGKGWQYEFEGKRFYILQKGDYDIVLETEIFYSKSKQVFDYLMKRLTGILPTVLRPAWYKNVYGS